MSEIEDLVSAVAGLQTVAEALAKRSEVQDKLLKRIEKLSADTHRNKVGIQIGTAGVVLALLVGCFAIVQSVRLNTLYHQVQEVQTRTSTEVLCPLYQLFALSITINPPPANYTAEQLKLRQQFADAMKTGLVKLGCPSQP